MSDFDFIAWSLAVSGIAALAMIGISRLAPMATGKPAYHPPRSAVAVILATTLLLGPVIMRPLSDFYLMPPPRWSSLFIGPLLALIGLSNLIKARESSPDRRSSHTMAYILSGLGLLIFVLEFLSFTSRT